MTDTTRAVGRSTGVFFGFGAVRRVIAAGLFRWCMPAGVGRDEHTAVMDLHEAAVHDQHDLLTREVAGDEVRRSPERHRTLP